MSNSPLVDYVRISPHKNSPRKYAIDKITIHHMAGNLTVEACGNVFQTKKASSNYGIGSDGRVGMYVEEKDRSWCSSSGANDHRAITIEVANNSGAPNWTVSDKAYKRLIELCVDICKRNGIKQLNWTGDASGNLTIHKFFTATACPGAYLEARMPQIAAEVNERLMSYKPLSDEPVRMKMGYASGGDVKSIEGLLKVKSIPFTTAEGYVTTDIPVSRGDQIGLVQLCAELGVPCVIYNEQTDDPVDADLEQQLAEANERIKELETDKVVLENRVKLREAEIEKLNGKIAAAQAALA